MALLLVLVLERELEQEPVLGRVDSLPPNRLNLCGPLNFVICF